MAQFGYIRCHFLCCCFWLHGCGINADVMINAHRSIQTPFPASIIPVKEQHATKDERYTVILAYTSTPLHTTDYTNRRLLDNKHQHSCHYVLTFAPLRDNMQNSTGNNAWATLTCSAVAGAAPMSLAYATDQCLCLVVHGVQAGHARPPHPNNSNLLKLRLPHTATSYHIR